MDNNKLLSNLNDQQIQAIINVDGPCRIIAGAGVGKTRVLTYKIVYLINVIKVPSEKILALTFTNKAASEMKNRVVKLLENDDVKVTIATYHSICAKILRRDIHHLKINNSFNIIDQEDQRKILKDICQKEFSHKADLAELKLLSNSISNWKNHHVTYDELLKDYQNQDQWILRAKVYESYKQYQLVNSCLDFDDLLLLVQRLFKEFPYVLKKWQDRFNFILVDEFQDTNDIQYSILLSFAANHNNITVVGDPDQTIYSFRGANINLILNFTKKFPNTQTFILNENYRSTTKILNTANSLIKNNVERIDKSLFTKNDIGNEVIVYYASSSAQEAHWVATSIKKIHLKYHLSLNNIVILYRNNYLSKDLEQALINNNLNYKIFGGYKFFERKEIKDILAYLKVIAWNDNLSMTRILNSIPKIGPKAIDHLLELAKENSLTLNEYLFQYQYNLPKNYRQHLQPLIKLINDIQINIDQVTSLHKLTEQVLTETNYLKILEEHLETERIENVKQLLSQLADFDVNNETKGNELLTVFLQEISLYTDLDENTSNKAVSLMTIHSAKGLEFDVVFIVGINEGILPAHHKNNDKENKIEEERRLFYVAITRAKNFLFLSSADGFSFVLNTMKQPSRFLKDLDVTHLKIINNEHQEMAASYQNRNSSKFNYYKFDANKDSNQVTINYWKIGDIIVHEIFGKGIITKLIGDKIQVAFHKNNGGIRILSAGHNAIKKLYNR